MELSTRYSNYHVIKRRKKNLINWINKCQKKFGSKFNYTKAKSVFQTFKRPKVPIVCKLHGEFYETPDSHFTYKTGCPQCGKELRANMRIANKEKQFLSKIKKKYGNSISLMSAYRGINNAVKIKCNLHPDEKEISVKASNLIYQNTKPCNKCLIKHRSINNRLSYIKINKHLNRLQKKEFSHIKFIKLLFDNSKKASRIIIKCKYHGKQNIDYHQFKSKYICPECGNLNAGSSSLEDFLSGKKKIHNETLGVMEIEHGGLRSLKVGRTKRTLKQRYAFNLKKVFYSKKFQVHDAMILENKIMQHFHNYKDYRIKKYGMRNGKRWAGDEELFLFRAKPLIIKFIKKFIQDVSNKNINYQKETDLYEEIDWTKPIDVSREKNLSNQPKKIVCITDNNKVFESIASATRFYNISNITKSVSENVLVSKHRFVKYSDWIKNSIPPLKKRKRFHTMVKCIETGKIYQSVKEAMSETGAKKVSSVCSGNNKTSNGLTFEYVSSPRQNLF